MTYVAEVIDRHSPSHWIVPSFPRTVLAHQPQSPSTPMKTMLTAPLGTLNDEALEALAVATPKCFQNKSALCSRVDYRQVAFHLLMMMNDSSHRSRHRHFHSLMHMHDTLVSRQLLVMTCIQHSWLSLSKAKQEKFLTKVQDVASMRSLVTWHIKYGIFIDSANHCNFRLWKFDNHANNFIIRPTEQYQKYMYLKSAAYSVIKVQLIMWMFCTLLVLDRQH